MNRWRDYLTTLIMAVISALLVRNFLVTAYKVPSGSMQPTLKSGDLIFSSRISYGFSAPFTQKKWQESLPDRGDVVVFSYSNQPGVNYVKRVIGLPGDRVQITKGYLTVNDEPLKYQKVAAQNEDNPNPDAFDIYEESFHDYKWRVIFQKNSDKKDFGPFVVPPGEVFLLGDNRDTSDDSRYWGTVPTNQIAGKIFLIWLSIDWQKRWGDSRYPSLRWERVFSSLH
ncbi:MAG: signal peptidase I [Bdellovibrio sp.]